MSSLEHAITIAAKAHEGQTDKAGAPYILHPLRVMLNFTQRAEQITAVLHDVVEDSDWTLDGLRMEGFSDQVLAAVDALTRQPKESYEDFLERASGNPIAKKVKLADMRDNMDLSRIANPGQVDFERIEKYRRGIVKLK